jgi:hypothetical protein
MSKYIGLSCPTNHVTKFIMQWRVVPRQEWTHLFLYTLETIPKNQYIELEVHRGTRYWEELTKNFKVTFSFESNNPLIDLQLQVLRNNFFALEDLLGSFPLYSVPRVTAIVE